MRQMNIGDLGFFIIQGMSALSKFVQTAHPDSTTDDVRWECVDIRAVKSMQIPVT